MFRLISAALVIPAICLAASPPAGSKAFTEQHCTECHDSEVKKGGLDLTALGWKPEDRKNFDAWVKVFDRVSSGEMPPAKKTRPDPKAQAAFLASLKKPLVDLNTVEQAKLGRTVLRRLNRIEYENTVHDLLGIDVPLAFILPEDTPLHGFDTVAEGLRFSQLQIEKYLEAADVALDAALVLTRKPEPLKQRFSWKEEPGIRKNLDTPPGTITDKNNPRSQHRVMFRETPDAVIMFTTADYLTGLKQCRIPAAGRYRIRISGYAVQSQGKPVNLLLYSNNYREKRLLTYCDMPPDQPREFEFTARLTPSDHIELQAEDVGRDGKGGNIYNVGAKEFTGTGLAMQWIEFEGPLTESWPPPSVKLAAGDVPLTELRRNKYRSRDNKQLAYELAPADAKQSLAEALQNFAERAFRRPLEDGEADRFVKLGWDGLAAGDTFEDALRVGLRALLTAPQFLLFEEHPGKLNDFALASRLSYFLWSTMPDEELLTLAAQNKLAQPAVLRAQVERLLDHSKSRAFTQNFTGQWLDLRSIDATTPDKRLYPEFDMLLQLSMVSETESFFSEMLRQNLPVTNFIHSDFVMVNSRLAEHYGIEGVSGEQIRRVSLPAGSPRGGVLAQASVLKVTANGTVTSPVLRGAWVMKRLLGQPPAPPPPNVGSIEPDTRGSTTIREQLDKHRHEPSCAVCHSKMDPPGFALENFDVIGGWRDRYRSQGAGDRAERRTGAGQVHYIRLGLAVDASGELSDGRKFKDISDFKKLLLSQPDDVLRCITQDLVIYGTGAGIQFGDRDAIEKILRQTKAGGSGLRSLVHAVVGSELFQRK